MTRHGHLKRIVGKDINTTYLVREDLVGRHSGKEPPPGIEI